MCLSSEVCGTKTCLIGLLAWFLEDPKSDTELQ